MAKTNRKDWKHKAELLKAIAHPERLAMLHLLSQAPEGKLSVKSLYEKLNLLQPIASRHLSILKSAGVVIRLQQGQSVFYCLRTGKKNVEALFGCFS